jgi:hypothetical protein
MRRDKEEKSQTIKIWLEFFVHMRKPEDQQTVA